MPYSDPARARSYQRDYRRLRRAGDGRTTPVHPDIPAGFRLATALPFLMPGVTDGRFFAQLGIQTYGFVPLRLPAGFDFWETMHGADERVPVDALDFGADAVYKALERFGAGH